MTDLVNNPVDPMTDEIRHLADDIFREKVLRARRIPPEQRMELGPQLFDWAVEQTLSGIRNRYPNADEAEVRRILHRRMMNKRMMDENGIYFDIEAPV